MHEERLSIENGFPLVGLKLELLVEVITIFKLGSVTDQGKRVKPYQQKIAVEPQNLGWL
jgi:hypothetical protein